MSLRRVGRTANGPCGAGARDRSVTIQQRPVADAVHPSGLPNAPWTTLVLVFMEKQDLKAQERDTADQTSATIDTRWEMAYQADMDPELVDVPKLRRLLFHGRVYDVVAANQIGRKAGIELLTLAGSRIPT